MDVEKFKSVKDFQMAFYELAKKCERKFMGEINEVHIYPKECKVSIVFK